MYTQIIENVCGEICCLLSFSTNVKMRNFVVRYQTLSTRKTQLPIYYVLIASCFRRFLVIDAKVIGQSMSVRFVSFHFTLHLMLFFRCEFTSTFYHYTRLARSVVLSLLQFLSSPIHQTTHCVLYLNITGGFSKSVVCVYVLNIRCYQ